MQITVSIYVQNLTLFNCWYFHLLFINLSAVLIAYFQQTFIQQHSLSHPALVTTFAWADVYDHKYSSSKEISQKIS